MKNELNNPILERHSRDLTDAMERLVRLLARSAARHWVRSLDAEATSSPSSSKDSEHEQSNT